MSSLVTSQARTDELIRFSSFDTNGFTPFVSTRTSYVVPTYTIDMLQVPEQTHYTIPHVQGAGRAPVVPRHTLYAMDELEVNSSRFRDSWIIEPSFLIALAISAGSLIWAVTNGRPRITRWYTKQMASRSSRNGRSNLLLGPGGESQQ